jgi:hypothetical protein
VEVGSLGSVGLEMEDGSMRRVGIGGAGIDGDGSAYLTVDGKDERARSICPQVILDYYAQVLTSWTTSS